MIRRALKVRKTNSFFLFGARGTGKSTLLKETFGEGEALWIDLLKPELESQLLLNPSMLMEMWRGSGKEWVVIDEVQKLPKLLDVAHKMIEEHNVKFALTGSSARKLKRGNANLLAGRAFSFELFPFSAQELADEFDLEGALSFGTLPGVHNQSAAEDKLLFLESYVLNYVKEEIQSEQIVRAMEPFRKFLPVSALSAGRPLNFAKIGRDSGVDPKSVERYFVVLADTLMGFFLDAFSKSVRKKQRQAPKFYFFDVGVQRALAQQLDIKPKVRTSYYGELFEAFAMTEIHRLNSYTRSNYQMSYLQSGDGLEIDLILEKAGQVIWLVEIKSSETIHDEDLRHLRAVAADFPKAEKVVLSRVPQARRTPDDLQILPWREGMGVLFGRPADVV